MAEEDDLHEVMEADRRRGRRPIDIAARRERDEIRKVLIELLKAGDEKGFMQAMRAYGWSDDSAEFQRAMKVWRAKPKT